MPDGSISLPACLYLLAWDTSKLRLAGRAQPAHLVRAGALTELAQRGLLIDEDGVATLADPDAHTGDPVLDGLLELVEESRPRPWKSWVTLYAGVTLDAVRAGLAADGFLRADKKRVLGVFPSVEYEVERVSEAEAYQQEVHRALVGPVPVAEVSARDAALVALAAAAELPTVATAAELKRHKERIEALADRGGAAAPALKKVVHEVRTAMIVAIAAAATMAAGN